MTEPTPSRQVRRADERRLAKIKRSMATNARLEAHAGRPLQQPTRTARYEGQEPNEVKQRRQVWRARVRMAKEALQRAKDLGTIA